MYSQKVALTVLFNYVNSIIANVMHVSVTFMKVYAFSRPILEADIT